MAVDVELVLKKLESMEVLRTSKIRGDYYSIYCPFHKDGQEKKPSCGVLIKDQYRNGKHQPSGFIHCFTCGHSGPLERWVPELLRLKGVTSSGLDWLKENIPGFDESEIDIDSLVPSELMSTITNKFTLEYISRKTNEIKSNNFISEETLAKYRFTVPYMYERGLTDEIIERFDIGFDQNHIPDGRKNPVPCITFPVRDRKGNCVFIFRRSVEGRYFNYPEKVEKPVYGLYELKPGTKTVVICESAFNMMTCIRHGYEAVALFGTGNELQIRQLKEMGVSRFILAMDPDEAGRRATNKLKKRLRQAAFISTMEGIPDGKDINDLTDEEFNNLVIV